MLRSENSYTPFSDVSEPRVLCPPQPVDIPHVLKDTTVCLSDAAPSAPTRGSPPAAPARPHVLTDARLPGRDRAEPEAPRRGRVCLFLCAAQIVLLLVSGGYFIKYLRLKCLFFLTNRAVCRDEAAVTHPRDGAHWSDSDTAAPAPSAAPSRPPFFCCGWAVCP